MLFVYTGYFISISVNQGLICYTMVLKCLAKKKSSYVECFKAFTNRYPVSFNTNAVCVVLKHS